MINLRIIKNRKIEKVEWTKCPKCLSEMIKIKDNKYKCLSCKLEVEYKNG